MSSHTSVVGYRRDIDGLRAIAVIPVVLFHAGVPWMSGGFVGVDVFFVISGYLITTLILNDIRAGRFSLASFYERRTRRILPALIGVLLFSSIAAHVLLLPNDAREFGGSLLAAVLFSSNILFWWQSGYFAQAAEAKPLLHTWSLAVEEQFYILYPLFLVLIGRYFRGRYAAAIAGALVTSLGLSIWGVATHPMATFYLLPTRAWELLLGALLSIKVIPTTRDSRLANMLGSIGLFGIGYGVFAFSSGTPFPGVHALCPALGTALILYAGTAGTPLVTRTLSLRPLAFVGRISYSLYLWHWVLLVFSKHSEPLPVTSGQVALVVTASVIVATASWRFIEGPFRGPLGLGSRRWLLASAAASSLALGCYGLAALASDGMPGRFGKETLALLADGDDVWHRRKECADTVCSVGNPDLPPTFVLWGDSHVGALAPAVEQAALRDHRSGLIASEGGCAPLLQLRRYERDGKACGASIDAVLARIESANIRNVFLHARWGLYAEGNRYKQEGGEPLLLTARRRVEDDYAEFTRLLRLTLAELHRRGLSVVIIASIPEVGIEVPRALLRVHQRPRWLGAPGDPAPSYAEFATRQFRSFRALRQVAAEYAVPIVYPHELLCDGTQCLIERDGHPLYSDAHHLNTRGAMYLLPLFDRLLATLRVDGPDLND